MCPLCWGTSRWWGVEKTTYNRWWFPSFGSTVCRCWYCSYLLVDQAAVLLPGEACCHELNTIVDFVGNFLFAVVVGTIQPFEVGSTKPCCLHVFVESEVLTCCCYLNSSWWCCHSVGCHSSCCWSKRRWRQNTVETKRLRLNIQLLSAFSCWHSQRRSLLLFNKNVELMKQKSKQNMLNSLLKIMLSKTSCCQKLWRSRLLAKHVEIHSLKHKKDVVEILRVEVSHGSTRPLDVCKVCAGCIYCLLKQFSETLYVASSEAYAWIVLDVQSNTCEITLQCFCWNVLRKDICRIVVGVYFNDA